MQPATHIRQIVSCILKAWNLALPIYKMGPEMLLVLNIILSKYLLRANFGQ